MKYELAKFEEALRDNNLKVTEPRLKIARKVFGTHKHFTADELLDWLRAEDTQASKATVYRTLNLMVKEKLVDEHDFERGQKLYEHSIGHPHHDHLICVDCGRIVEFQNDEIEHLQLAEAKKLGFALKYHSHKLFGVCATCRKQGDGT